MAQTYCTEADIQALIGVAAVTSCVDDDVDGAISAAEQTYITSAIEHAASRMNSRIQHQYPTLSNLASNDWCKWCNASIAAMILYGRRANTPPTWLVEEYDEYLRVLEEVRWGREQIPEQTPEFDARPAVSNFEVEMGKSYSPVRVNPDESTGPTPHTSVKREVTDVPGAY